MHHIAFATHEKHDIIQICDKMGALRISDRIERGPGRHGVSNAFYLYILDPDGHRVEIYTQDYYTGDPDNPIVTWDVHDNQRRDWWGNPVVPSWYTEAQPRARPGRQRRQPVVERTDSERDGRDGRRRRLLLHPRRRDDGTTEAQASRSAASCDSGGAGSTTRRSAGSPTSSPRPPARRGTVERISRPLPGDDHRGLLRGAAHLARAPRRPKAHRVVGRKIGLTSKAMQFATGITEPDYGVIFDDQVFGSGADVVRPRARTCAIEVELAFVLRPPLAGAGLHGRARARRDRAGRPALEVLDSHIELEGRTIVDTISDNAALGADGVGDAGSARTTATCAGSAALLARNGEIEESGVSGAVLGHPANGVAWLAGKLAQHGDRLEAGEIVLAGSFTRPMWVRRGDLVACDYRDLGVVTCRFR